MGFPVCNDTLDLETINEIALPHLSSFWTFHHLGLVLAASTGLFAVVLSLALIFLHATHYTRPWEQKHIIRILFMVPIYAIVSYLSYTFYRKTVYFAVLRDCYEAFAIASFFQLLVHYLAPNLHDQKEYMRTLVLRPWVFPLRQMRVRTPRSGVTWFHIMYFFVFLYCFIRVSMTIVAVVTQHFGRYCSDSLNPGFAHIWVVILNSLGVLLAMYCVVQIYVQFKEDLREHRIGLKLLAIKLVIFLSFWQTTVINFITSSSVWKATDTIATVDVKVGVPAVLLCIEMAVFSILHLWAYPWRVYQTSRISKFPEDAPSDIMHNQGGVFGIWALADAFNPWDVIKAVARSFKLASRGLREKDRGLMFDDPSHRMDVPMTGSMLGGGRRGSSYQQLHSNESSSIVHLPPADNRKFAQPVQEVDIGAAGQQQFRTAYHETPTTVPLEKPTTMGQDTSYHGAAGAPLRFEPYRPSPHSGPF